MDSMGRHKTAARSIQWFLDRQDENGYINSYADYESETGPSSGASRSTTG